MGRADRHFLLDFTRAARADEGSVALDDGDVEYQLRGRGQTRPDLVTLRWSPRLRERLEELRAHTEAGVGEAAARLGQIIADFLDAPAWTRAADALGQADGGDAWLTVRSNAAELYLLPWELVSVGDVAHVGSLSRLLLRYEWPDTRTAPRLAGLSQTARGRVVFAWSAAGGKVQASAHVALIEKAAQRSRACFDAPDPSALDEVKNASCASLRAALERAKSEREPVAVLHLLCHGSERDGSFGLCLDSEDGAGVDVVNAGRFAMLLRDYAGLVRLVVVSACDSGNAGEVGQQLGSVAQEVHKAGFGAVIASRLPLSWDGARLFAAALYDGILGALLPLEDVLLQCRARLMERASYDWASLQLYAREADGDATYVFQARPYRGLAAYGPEHARFFFGREREIAEVVGDLDALVAQGRPRLLVVSGASGTGKSSMVLGGAIPFWKARGPEGGFTSIVVRPGEHPSTALAEVEARLAIVGDVCRRFVVVVDQFEEVFTHDAREEAAALVRALWRLAVEPESPVCVLLTMRIDFLGRCNELVLDDAGLRFDKVACDAAHQVLVAQMSPEQLREAVERPALAAGLALEPGLAEDIVRDVEAAPGALPLMSHALYLLWKRRRGDVLTRADYRALGAVQGALDAHAEQVREALRDEAERTVRRLMLALVHASAQGATDTRRRRAVDELRERFAAERERFEAVLRQMVDARLLVTGGADQGAMTVEVAHEALLRSWKRLKGWIDEDRTTLVQLAQLDAWAAEWRLRPDALLRGSRLAVAEEADRTHGDDLGSDARALLTASRAERAREQAEAERARRVRRAVIAVVFVALSGVALGGVALWRRADVARAGAVKAAREADRARREAQASEVRSRASELRARADTPDLEAENLADTIQFRAEVIERLREVPAVVDAVMLQTAAAAILRPVLADAPGEHDSWAFSPDGTRLAGCADDSSTLSLWNTSNGLRAAPLEERSQGRLVGGELRFTPDGAWLVARFWDETARTWGADDGTPSVMLDERSTSANELAQTTSDTGGLSSDGAATRFNQVVRSTRDGRVLATLPEGLPGLLDFSVTPDGARLLLALNDGTVRTWDVRRAAFEAESVSLQRHRGLLSAMFSPGGARLTGRSVQGPTVLWDTRDGRQLRELSDSPYLPRFSDGGRYVLQNRCDAAGTGCETQLWDASGAAVPAADRLGAVVDVDDAHARSLSLQEGGHAVLLTDLAGGSRVTGYIRGGAAERGAFAPGGLRLLVRSPGGSVHLWNEGDGVAVLTLGERRTALSSVAFTRDGGAVLTTGASEVALWDARDGSRRASPRGVSGDALAAALSPDGARLAILHADQMARLWDTGTGAPLIELGRYAPSREFDVGGVVVRAEARRMVAFSGDGAWLLTTAVTGDAALANTAAPSEVRVWAAASGALRQTLRAEDHGGVARAWFSPDGSRVLASLTDFSARLWDTRTGAVVADLPAGEGELVTHAFLAGGARLVTARASGLVVTWDARTGARLGTVRLDAAFSRAALSPDGARLLAVSSDNVDVLWDATHGRRLATLPNAAGLPTHVAFTADHTRLATAYENGSFALWEGDDGAPLVTVPAHLAAITGLTFAPDGSRLATASADGTARLWALDPAVVTRAACASLRPRAIWRERPALQAACGERAPRPVVRH